MQVSRKILFIVLSSFFVGIDAKKAEDITNVEISESEMAICIWYDWGQAIEQSERHNQVERVQEPHEYHATSHQSSCEERENSSWHDHYFSSVIVEAARENALDRMRVAAEEQGGLLHEQQARDPHDFLLNRSLYSPAGVPPKPAFVAQRSSIYLCCKYLKERCVGLSQKTKQELAKKAHEEKVEERKLQVLENVEKKQPGAKPKSGTKLTKKEQQAQELKLHVEELEQAFYEHHMAITEGDNKAFLEILHKRDKAFSHSLLAPRGKTRHGFTISSKTRDFMRSHNLDLAQFNGMMGIPIEHHLAQELLHNLEVCAQLAERYSITEPSYACIKMCVAMCGMAQAYNQSHQLVQAISATNCSHGFLYYAQSMIESHTFHRCQKLSTSLAFFNAEVASYVRAVGKGVIKAVGVSEVVGLSMTGLSMLATKFAPELTAAVYAGAISLSTPLAVIGGTLCALAIGAELSYLAIAHSFQDHKLFDQELIRIKSFAQQFYDFDQAPVGHVENLAYLATSLGWPLCRQAVFDAVRGVHTVTCNVYAQGKRILQTQRKVHAANLAHAVDFVTRKDFDRFFAFHEKIFGRNTFNIHLLSNPALAPAGMQGMLSSAEQQAALAAFLKTEGKDGVNHAIKTLVGVASPLFDSVKYPFCVTPVGKKMIAAAAKKYEQGRVLDAAKEYNKLLAVQTPENLLEVFARCHEIGVILPERLARMYESYEEFKKFCADPDNNLLEFQDAVIQIKHIFYPSVEPRFDSAYQIIERFVLNGFHHDEYNILEKMGLFTYAEKVQGSPEFGAQDCIAVKVDFGDGIVIDKWKTCFPSNWSQKDVLVEVCRASKNIVDDLTEIGSPHKVYLCQGPSGIFIQLIIDGTNRITSFYPSKKNFPGLKL